MNSIHNGRGWPMTCWNSGIGAPGAAVLAAPLMRAPPVDWTAGACPTEATRVKHRDVCCVATSGRRKPSIGAARSDRGAALKHFGEEGPDQTLTEEAHPGKTRD